MKITDDILNGLLATAGKEAKNRVNEECRIKNEKVANFLKKAQDNSNLLTGDILRDLINQHIKTKETCVYNNEDTPQEYEFSFNRVSKIIGFREGSYLLECENIYKNYFQKRDKELSDAIKKIDEDVLKILRQETDKYNGLVMRYARRDDSLIPSIIDWDFFKKNGINFKFDGYFKIESLVMFDTVETLVNKIISGEIDATQYLSQNEINNYRAKMKKITENQVKISQFINRCDNNLEIVVLDVIKALLDVYREKHKNLSITEYEVIIPCYQFSRYASQDLKPLSFKEKIGQEEFELIEWMCKNSSIQKILTFQHEKDGKIEYLPVNGEDFTSIVVHNLELTMVNYDLEDIKIIANAQRFTKKILKAVEESENATEKIKEERTL